MQENYQNNLNVEYNNELSQSTVVKPQVAKYKWAILGTVLIALIVLFCYLILSSYSGISFAGFGVKTMDAVMGSESDFYWIDYNSDDGIVYSWRFTDIDSCERNDLMSNSTEYYSYVDNGSYLSIDNDRFVLYYDYNEGVYWYYSPDLKYKCLLCKSETNEYDTDKASCYKYRADTGEATVNDVKDSIDNAEQNESTDETVLEGANQDLEGLYNLSSGEVFERYFKNAIMAYGLFDGFGCLDCEYDVTYETEMDGITLIYNPVKKKQTEYSFLDFSSYKSFKKSLNSIFSTKIVDRLLSYNYFIEVDGKVYAYCPGRGSDITYIDSKYAVTYVQDDKIELTVTARYIKDEYFDTWYDNGAEIKDNMVDVREIKFELKNYDGKWVFDKFDLWY